VLIEFVSCTLAIQAATTRVALAASTRRPVQTPHTAGQRLPRAPLVPVSASIVAVVRRAYLFLASRKLSSARMRGLTRNPEQSRSEHRSFRPADRGGGLVSGIAFVARLCEYSR
jgi:hypothetical protein